MANPHPVSRQGKPNKASIVRAERAVAEGKKLPPDELLRNAENCRSMAARYAPMRIDQNTKQPVQNKQHNPELYGYWLAAERDALKAAAPYYAPRLTAIALQTTTLDKGEDHRGDPREFLRELFMQMASRREIGRAALPAPKGKGNGDAQVIEATVVETVKEEDEDNGDGEAV